ncbi:peroxidasin homolog isoform X2 [Antedon mediterranea]|uniref:peroxidasin homolog isoform X2 n=1 Tax=Antedon mediterranea TaxID=105859 RepID=UPI003AF8CDF7
MDFKLFVLFVGAVFPSVCLGVICPSRCLCFRTTVRCMHLDLRLIPQVSSSTTILDLRFNRIDAIPPGSFSNLRDLNTLLLSNNDIRKIKNGAFDGLHQLRYLYLYKNRISEVESKAFSGLRNLEQLYLYSNMLATMHTNTFNDLPALERLFLNNNNISHIPLGTFTELRNLKRLRLDSNRLVCDCKMMWLVQMLQEAGRYGHTQSAAACEYPKELRGKNLISLTPIQMNCQRPHFVLEPTDVEVSQGKSVYFTCRATGDPEPSITWLRNKVEIETSIEQQPDAKYTILTDGTLMILDASGEDEGDYECMARNAVGEAVTRTASLSYFGEPKAPQFVKEPDNIDIRAGDNVEIQCAVSGHPRPIITWTKNDKQVVEDNHIRLLSSGSLHISEVQFDDRGIYECSATNQEGIISTTAVLTVFVPPSFIQRPEFQATIEGSTVEFHCTAEGNPSPVIAWKKKGLQLPDDRRHVVLSSGTLRIVRATRADEGNYECQAFNSAGSSQATAQLEVRPRIPPTFEVTPSDLTIVTGGTVELLCSAQGEPTPVITWSKDGVQITPSAKFLISNNHKLVITDVGRVDEGRYDCAARNSIGYASTSMELKVADFEGPREGNQYVDQSIDEAVKIVDKRINETISILFDTSKPRSPSDLLTLFRFPSDEAVNIARAAEIYEQTLLLIHESVERGILVNMTDYNYNELLSPSFLNVIANKSGCIMHRNNINCSDMCFHKKYRNYDGTCNNLRNPEWGASLTRFNRILKPIYENGFNTPVGWNVSHLYNGFQKPSARKVSLEVISTHSVTPNEKYSHMVMQWGQFLDHDMDFTVTSLSKARFTDGVECKDTCENAPPCFPIRIPEGDPRIRRSQCMEFTRSSAICGSGMTSVFFESPMPREQINQITSYIDASNVYGSIQVEAVKLRDFTNDRGLLKEGRLVESSGKRLLPFNHDSPIDCERDLTESTIPCFLAGDFRANEQLGLLSMHTIWMREHNRIAQELLKINPHWSGEQIYQETRKINGAQMQHISYNHWLPKVLGPEGMKQLGDYAGYDPSIDASIINVFATAAFRFGHSLINPFIQRLNSSFLEAEHGHIPLHKAFFSPFRIVEEGGIDPILRGLYGTPAKEINPGELVNRELTEHLFQMAHSIALDLAALNIQRGRDHAIPSYNDWRVKCNLSAAETFDDVTNEISDHRLRRKLEDLYKHPGNIDLWVAGLAEDPLDDGLLGPTFTCIIAEQFKRTRQGDRLWYEKPSVFEPAQLQEIKQTSLSAVICNNADDIKEIQRDAFLRADYPHGYLKCDSIPKIDLRMWTDCEADGPATVTNIFRRKRSASESANKQIATGNKINSDISMEIRGAQLEETVNEMQSTIKILQKNVDSLTQEVKRLKRKKRHN